MNLTKQNVLSYFSQMWRENPLRPPFINTIGHLSQLHVRLGIVLGTLSCLFIAGLLLSPPQRPFCVVGRLGRGKNESAQGTMRSGKRGNEAFSLYPSSTTRLPFFKLLLSLLEYQAGASAEEPERGWAESIKTFPVQFDPALTQFHERP